MMFPAIFSRTYPARSVSEVFTACRDDGYGGVQLNLSSAGLETMPETVPQSLLEAIRAAVVSVGIKVCAVSATYNMAHPDPSQRNKMRTRLGGVIAAAGHIGSPVVTVCTGSRDEADMWRFHSGNATESAWSDMRCELDVALELASTVGVRIGIEPEPGNVVSNARLARRLLDEVSSDHIGIVFDAANICAHLSISKHRDRLDEAFELLGDDIILAHAKDFDDQGHVVPPGSGVIDLPFFVRKLDEAGYDRGLIGHGFEVADTKLAACYLRELCEE